MSAKKRNDLITKLYKVCKKQYQYQKPPSNRTVLEHMLYGCCLENSTFEAADETLAKLQENYCDWNEVRVTTADELAEVGKSLTEPRAAAMSVKRTLFGIFEKYFQYDIDFLKKENLSKAVEAFEKFKGVSPFVVSYVAQNGLGGHSIPLDRSMLSLFYVLGIISEDEAMEGKVPGLERTIPKAKGAEFFVVVHQLAVAFATTPFSNSVRKVLTDINPDAKERFPKRASRKKSSTSKSSDSAETSDSAKKATKATTKKKVTKKKVTKSTKASAKKTTKKKTSKSTKKKTARKTTTKKKSATRKLSKKKPR